jgi:hypothetical protein
MLHYAVSLELPETVSGLSLIDTAGDPTDSTTPPANGITLDSATKLDGVVTLKLVGKVKGAYTLEATDIAGTYTEGYNFKGNDYFGLNLPNAHVSTRPEPGTYAVIKIKGLYAYPTVSKTTALKQTNQAYRIYQYDGYFNTTNGQALSGKPTAPQKAKPTMWIPGADETEKVPVNWAVSTKSRGSDDVFSFPIWNGGTRTEYDAPKEVKLEITEYNNDTDDPLVLKPASDGGYAATFIVDYSAVDFEEPIETDPGVGG